MNITVPYNGREWEHPRKKNGRNTMPSKTTQKLFELATRGAPEGPVDNGRDPEASYRASIYREEEIRVEIIDRAPCAFLGCVDSLLIKMKTHDSFFDFDEPAIWAEVRIQGSDKILLQADFQPANVIEYGKDALNEWFVSCPNDGRKHEDYGVLYSCHTTNLVATAARVYNKLK